MIASRKCFLEEWVSGKRKLDAKIKKFSPDVLTQLTYPFLLFFKALNLQSSMILSGSDIENNSISPLQFF